MPSFGLDEKQQMLVATVRKIAQEKIRPGAIDREFSGKFPWDTFELLKKHGFVGIGLPEEYGGQGGGLLDLCLVTEEISKVCNNSAIPITLSAMFSIPLLLFGTEEQKRKYIPIIASGDWVGCYGLTEPNAGSDASAIESTAVRQGDHYILNGMKCFISNFTVASVVLIMAKTDTTIKPSKGITAFMVEKNPNGDTPGFVNVKVMPKWSMLAIPTCEFTMENLEVPAENVLGKEGEGFKIALASLDRARIATAAHAIGVAQGAIDECVEYTKIRRAFGQKISAFQGIQFKLADMQTKVAAARLLVHEAALANDVGDPKVSFLGAMAKLFACDVAEEVATEGAQILGGIGFLRTTSMCRRMLDMKAWQIAEGSQEIQRVIIAREMLREK